MDGYVSKTLRRERRFRCVVSSGHVERPDTELIVRAWDKNHARDMYQFIMAKTRPGTVHVLDPVLVTEIPETVKHGMERRSIDDQIS